MAKDKIYPGQSAFFANRKGNHNWLDNNARPFLSVTTTNKKGKRKFNDLFINKDATVKVTDTKVTITFDAAIGKPLFSVLDKD